MQGKAMMKVVLGALMGLAILSGCAGNPKITSTTPIQDIPDRPEWVIKDSSALNNESGNAFYGVGVSNFKDVVIQRKSADNQARNEVAKVLEVKLSSLEKEAAAETVAGEDRALEKLAEIVMKVLVDIRLSGVYIVDHWQHPATGDLYALAKLDLEAFRKAVEDLQEMKKLDQKAKKRVKEYMYQLFNELDKEKAKAAEE